jgi:hypothetical protein
MHSPEKAKEPGDFDRGGIAGVFIDRVYTSFIDYLFRLKLEMKVSEVAKFGPARKPRLLLSEAQSLKIHQRC